MTLHSIQGVGSTGALRAPQPAASGNGDGQFGELLNALGGMEAEAEAALTDLAVGGERDLQDVVLAVEMESIAFELAVQIRNRLVSAYQEIFRMSV